jgi:hypothetical protein
MNNITNDDYKNILEYYKISIPRSERITKMQAEKILSTKLCRCIKKLQPKNESRAIGICTKTIFNRKGYSRGKFKCKGKKYVLFSKTKKNKKNRKSRKNRK